MIRAAWWRWGLRGACGRPADPWSVEHLKLCLRPPPLPIFQMTPSHHPVSQFTLLSLALLWPVSSRTLSPGTSLPDPAVDAPRREPLLPATLWPQDPWGVKEGSWEEEELLRVQRKDVVGRSLPPPLGGFLHNSLHYEEHGGVDGGQKNKALHSIAGGLQAVSREKGGFGFRFGRKRWTDRGWREG